MKRSTVRPQDWRNAERLRQYFRPGGRLRPVKKYRDVSAMEGNTLFEKGDPRLFEAIRAVWDLAHRTIRPSFPPGVYKHRSIEDTQALRREWDRANLEAFHARQRKARVEAESR